MNGAYLNQHLPEFPLAENFDRRTKHTRIGRSGQEDSRAAYVDRKRRERGFLPTQDLSIFDGTPVEGKRIEVGKPR